MLVLIHRVSIIYYKFSKVPYQLLLIDFKVEGIPIINEKNIPQYFRKNELLFI